MSDEFTIDAKYKRDNLLDEHRRYQQGLEAVIDAIGSTTLPSDPAEALEVAAGLLDDLAIIARQARGWES